MLKKVMIFILLVNLLYLSSCKDAYIKDYKIIFNESFKQQYKLSCEIACLRAILMFEKNILISEDDIFAKLRINDNPHFGFRGDKDGSQKNTNLADYGVYAKALSQYLSDNLKIKSNIYGDLEEYSYIRLGYPMKWIKNNIDKNKPVVVWIIKKSEKTPQFYRNEVIDNNAFKLIYNEHTVIILGYNDEKKINNFTCFEPKTGEIEVYNQNDFLISWSYFNYMALTIE